MEKEKIRVVLATEDDWQAYKKMRLAAITSKYAKMFGFNLKKEMEMSEEDWRELSRGNKFVVLAWYETEPIGVGFVEFRKDYWCFRSGFVFGEYQGQGIGKRIFQLRLQEVKKRGGKKVRLGLRRCNKKSFNLSNSCGFKKISKWEQLKIMGLCNIVSLVFYHIMELDL